MHHIQIRSDFRIVQVKLSQRIDLYAHAVKLTGSVTCPSTEKCINCDTRSDICLYNKRTPGRMCIFVLGMRT